jgi:hypothetical protein
MARATDFTNITTFGYAQSNWSERNFDCYLVEFQSVQQVIQLPVLANFI